MYVYSVCHKTPIWELCGSYLTGSGWTWILQVSAGADAMFYAGAHGVWFCKVYRESSWRAGGKIYSDHVQRYIYIYMM